MEIEKWVKRLSQFIGRYNVMPTYDLQDFVGLDLPLEIQHVVRFTFLESWVAYLKYCLGRMQGTCYTVYKGRVGLLKDEL